MSVGGRVRAGEQSRVPLTVQLLARLNDFAPVVTLGVIAAVLDDQARPGQFPRMVAEELGAQLVFRVCNGQRFEQLARFAPVSDSGDAEDGAGERLPRRNVAHHVVPLWQARVALRVEEGSGRLAHAEGPEVVAAHGGVLCYGELVKTPAVPARGSSRMPRQGPTRNLSMAAPLPHRRTHARLRPRAPHRQLPRHPPMEDVRAGSR